MNPADLLEASLLDLLYELKDTEISLILGGGYGLHLKRLHALKKKASGERLLLSVVSPARSTNDLDIFLRTEIIANPEQVKQFRDALDRLGFRVIESAKYYQFVRTITTADGKDSEVKIDLLTRRPDPAMYSNLEVDDRRVRPKPSLGLHAHTTNEALAIEDDSVEILLSGVRTMGDSFSARIYVPQTYSFLMMKLFAFRDQSDKEWKEYGREHALDLYTLVSILTEDEFAESQNIAARYKDSTEANEAGEIVASLFADPASLGVRRLREHYLFSANMDIEQFIAVLKAIFPS